MALSIFKNTEALRSLPSLRPLFLPSQLLLPLFLLHQRSCALPKVVVPMNKRRMCE